MLAKGCVSRWSVAGLEALGHFLLSFLRVSTVTSNFFILFFLLKPAHGPEDDEKVYQV